MTLRRGAPRVGSNERRDLHGKGFGKFLFHKYYDWPSMLKGISDSRPLMMLTPAEEANSMVQLDDQIMYHTVETIVGNVQESLITALDVVLVTLRIVILAALYIAVVLATS